MGSIEEYLVVIQIGQAAKLFAIHPYVFDILYLLYRIDVSIIYIIFTSEGGRYLHLQHLKSSLLWGRPLRECLVHFFETFFFFESCIFYMEINIYIYTYICIYIYINIYWSCRENRDFLTTHSNTKKAAI